MYSINCKGKLLSLNTPIVMGIINATPDSFYTKDSYQGLTAILTEAEKMLQEGATILDIGGLSTRPGAAIISPMEETDRVIPVIEVLQQNFPHAILSIDSYRASVAKAAVLAGAHIINDISAGSLDNDMIATVGHLQVPYIAMHMQGNPSNMQDNPQYDNIGYSILHYLANIIATLRAHNIKDIIIDPGFGFGKTMAHNYELLHELHTFQILDVPILAGVSRKSMIYKLLNTTPKEALDGTTALHMICLQQGAKILRVHDVKAAKDCVEIFNYYTKING